MYLMFKAFCKRFWKFRMIKFHKFRNQFPRVFSASFTFIVIVVRIPILFRFRHKYLAQLSEEQFSKEKCLSSLPSELREKQPGQNDSRKIKNTAGNGLLIAADKELSEHRGCGDVLPSD